MKLNARQLFKIEEKLNCEVVPEDHEASSDLKEAYGDHTFLLDDEGLNIIEPAPSNRASAKQATASQATANHATECQVIKLASWNQDGTELRGHAPQVRPIKLNLGDGRSDGKG